MNKVEQQLGTPKSKSLATDTPPRFNTNTPMTGVATPTSNTPKTGQKQSSNPLILLVGKLVFLDLNSSYKPLNKVKQCLNLIGAVSYGFFYYFKFELNLNRTGLKIQNKKENS